MTLPDRPAGGSRFATQPIAEAIADERAVDWNPAERALGAQAPALASLRLIDDVARAFRATMVAPAEAVTPPRGDGSFAWGPLTVLEPLGEGMTGQVHRAFDPALQRTVALKLRACRDPALDPANSQLIAEAQRLAQVRHRNVLAVYGAAVHDGRAGIWTELIDGRTLAALVAADGPLGGDEAIAIGLDLCRALAAIHGAGLVHGDVKAENVMRERGGRIVLMDFGASGRAGELAGRAVFSGTRRYLAPELLAGDGGPDARGDVYALGVLLHFLLSGDFPRGDGQDALQPLSARRPDLPEALARLVDEVVADDPAVRPATVHDLQRRLIALLPAPGSLPVPRSARQRSKWALAAVATLALLSAWLWRSLPTPPAWQADSSFVDADRGTAVADGQRVRLGDRLALNLALTAPTHVYVVNEDADGELSLLFPLDGLDLANPLAGGDVELPGTLAGERVSWEISSPSAHDEFAVIASAQPLPRLLQRLAGARAASRPDPTARQRGAGTLAASPSALPPVHGAGLAELLALAHDEAGDAALHVRVVRLPHVP